MTILFICYLPHMVHVNHVAVQLVDFLFELLTIEFH